MKQRRHYLRPAVELITPVAKHYMMAMSIGENTQVPVNVNETHDAEDALVREDPFSFEWD